MSHISKHISTINYSLIGLSSFRTQRENDIIDLKCKIELKKNTNIFHNAIEENHNIQVNNANIYKRKQTNNTKIINMLLCCQKIKLTSPTHNKSQIAQHSYVQESSEDSIKNKITAKSQTPQKLK